MNEAWTAAQHKELEHEDTASAASSLLNYRTIVQGHFGLDDSFFAGKTILEVGCGPWPLSIHVPDCLAAVIVEPLWERFSRKAEIFPPWSAVPVAFEDFAKERMPRFDEVWLFNFLQHVASDPRSILRAAARLGGTLRVFEPVDTPVDTMHLHSLSVAMFREVFPAAQIGRYRGGAVRGFHTADCAYFSVEGQP